MHDPIAVLAAKKFDTTNHLAAVQDVSAKNFSARQYRDAIAELVGDVTEFGSFDDLTAKFFYKYLVQNLVQRHNNADDKRPIEVVIQLSFEHATKMCERVRVGDFAFAQKLEDNAAFIAGNTVDEQSGEVIPQVRTGRKGEKRDRAIVLYQQHKDKLDRNGMIDLFMKELDMSKAGATTYVYMAKKEAV